MSKHTPGPWRIIEHNWRETSIEGKDNPSNVCLLDISLHDTNEATDDEIAAMQDVQLANAKLIAAAPDLLGALIVMKAEYSFHTSEENSHAIRMATEAIKKATS